MHWHSLLGVAALPALAWLLSEDRRAVRWRLVGAALLLQVSIAAACLHLPPLRRAFLWLNAAVEALQQATTAGTAFVFGYLGGAAPPFAVEDPAATFVFAFRALPLVLVLSALSALLFHWRVLPAIVRGFAAVLRRTLGVGGAVGVAAAANVFVGMIEAPLLIRPYLARLGRGELFMVMTCGMATIAGTVFVLYATMLQGVVPDAAGQLLTASLISAPAALMIAELMLPAGVGGTAADAPTATGPASSAMEAIVAGTTEGVGLVIAVAAMLVVALALVGLVDQALGLLPDVAAAPLTLRRLFAWPMAPLAWLTGIPWAEAGEAGRLLATKTVTNELVAYAELAALPAGTLSERSRLIVAYALCGFANFGSLGILVGGLAAMVPERRAEIVALAPRSLVSGTLATCLTGAVVGFVG